jgi:hypothetical protein
MVRKRNYALSLRQPWAALLVYGHKTIEVRRWPTARRGPVLIHAASTPDPRPAVWELVADELQEEAALCGGIVGVADLTACIKYRTRAAFAADQEKHLNDPSWFDGKVLYGFHFANARPVPFRRCPGWFRFFEVKEE